MTARAATTGPRSPFRALLDLCDQIGRAKRRLDEGKATPTDLHRLRVRSRRDLAALCRRLRDEGDGGALADLSRRHRLRADELLVLAVLLSRYVSTSRTELLGREILEFLFDSTFEKLRGMALLRRGGTLRRAGLLRVVGRRGEGVDPLDLRFRLADRVARLLTGERGPRTDLRDGSLRRGPYRDEREYLLDLRDLAEACRERATLLFGPCDGNHEVDHATDLRGARARVRRLERAIERRFKTTPPASAFRFVKFRLARGLDEDEARVVAALLFQEVLEGEAFVPAVDLVRMVSDGEEEMLRKRNLFSRKERLVREGIVALEDPVEEKSLTSEVALANWVTEEVLGPAGSERTIAPDERIDFHLYLRNLDSSERFFKDLERGA